MQRLCSLAIIAVSAALAVSVAAQTPQPAQDTGKAQANGTNVPMVLNGCVTSPEPGTFTVQDEKKGRFQLTGRSLDIYIGKRVEVRGRSAGGLHITTGLYPSPNGAAQAVLDPVHAAQAALAGNSARVNTDAPLPKISVTRVKTVKGSCK